MDWHLLTKFTKDTQSWIGRQWLVNKSRAQAGKSQSYALKINYTKTIMCKLFVDTHRFLMTKLYKWSEFSYLYWEVFQQERLLYYQLAGPSLMKPKGLFGKFKSSCYKQNFWGVVRCQTTMKHVADWVCTTRPAKQQQPCPRINVTEQNETY